MSKNPFEGSDNSGSPIETDVPNPNNLGGEGETSGSDVKVEDKSKSELSEEQFGELESLVGRQGKELGEFRKFFADISPLLDKLDESPDIVQAIVEGKITSDLAKAAIEGSVSVEDAKIVSKAQDEIKKDLGKAEFKKTSADDISKLIEDKAKEIKSDLEKEFKSRDDFKTFESGVKDFVARTSDFPEYAVAVDKWLDDHDDVTDIAVAYYAVKGEISEKAATKKAAKDNAEAQKNMALNAGGGSSRATHIKGNDNVVDSLIASKSNPNDL